MNKEKIPFIENSYRALHGKLFSALINHFGIRYTDEIEDAIHNAFLKSLKSWNQKGCPDHAENWFFIVARNDVLNQIKKKSQHRAPIDEIESIEEDPPRVDLRLQTILWLASSKKNSLKAKTLFILKNIFGLNVREVSEATLMSQEAIYKSIKRTRKNLLVEFEHQSFANKKQWVNADIETVEDIIYAVFNIGFDSFERKEGSIVNEDLCLEAIAISNLLFRTHRKGSTQCLLSLFCFHISRSEAKVVNGKIISFLEQNKSLWNQELIKLGFHYLNKPSTFNRYYLEALIVSKYMVAKKFDYTFWKDIIELYKMLIQQFPSPIASLNLCYALHKAGYYDQAIASLASLENQLPEDHTYLKLMKAELWSSSEPEVSQKLMKDLVNNLTQSIRKEHLINHKLS